MTEITIMYFGGCALGLICGFILGLPIGALIARKEIEKRWERKYDESGNSTVHKK